MAELAQLDWVAIASRWLHILAAITAVGGTIFMRFALLPSVGALPDDERKKLHEGVRSRWVKFVMAAILFLLASGIYNLILKEKQFKMAADGAKSLYHTLYHMLFGVKFLLAFVIFFLASALTGRSPAFANIRQNARFWLTLNLVLAIIVVCVSGVLRAIPIS